MRLISLLLLLLSPLANAMDGDFHVGIGMALNNNTPIRPEVKSTGAYRGETVEMGVTWNDVIGRADAQLAWTYITTSDFGTEQAVSLTFVGGHRLQYGAGLLLGYSQGYERWQQEYVAPDPVRPRTCTFCGIVGQVGYRYNRVDLQFRYWRTDYTFYPGHNGALALLLYHF